MLRWLSISTFAWLALYFPLETYVTWSIAGAAGFLYSAYIANLTGMCLMVWGAFSGWRAAAIRPGSPGDGLELDRRDVLASDKRSILVRVSWACSSVGADRTLAGDCIDGSGHRRAHRVARGCDRIATAPRAIRPVRCIAIRRERNCSAAEVTSEPPSDSCDRSDVLPFGRLVTVDAARGAGRDAAVVWLGGIPRAGAACHWTLLGSLVYGGIPYGVLAMWATWRIGRMNEGEIKRLMVKAPFLMVLVYTLFWFLAGLRVGRPEFVLLGPFSAPVIIPVGLFYMAVVLLIREELGARLHEAATTRRTEDAHGLRA